MDRAARLKLDRLGVGRVTEVLLVTAKGKIAFGSMSGGGFALNGPHGRPDCGMLKSLIRTRISS